MEPTQQPNQQPPFFNGPFQPPTAPVPVVPQQPIQLVPAPQKKSKLTLLLIGVAVIELILIITLIVVVAGRPKTTSSKAGTSTSKNDSTSPATSASVQQTNDSISQDISGLNDDTDFPTNKLDDKSLGL